MAEDDRGEALRAQLEALSPQERAAVRAAAVEQLLRSRRTRVGGKVVSLKQLRDRVLRMREDYERGVYDESIRTVPRWQLQQATPSRHLRPGAHKQLLRKEEEEELALDRVGQGVVFSPSSSSLDRLLQRFNPLHKRDYAWAMYARPEQAERALSKAWAGQDPAQALSDGGLYHDIVRNCHQMELTLAVLACRPLPLAPLRQELAGRLQHGVELLEEPGSRERDQADLQRFTRLFDDERLRSASWVENGAVKAGTHLIVSASPSGALTLEAISPGSLRQRTTTVVGSTRSPAVTASLFNMFLGPRPLDPEGRRSVGNGMLWCANGGRFRLGAGGPQHEAAGPRGDAFPVPKHEVLRADHSVFSLLGGSSGGGGERGGRLLLQGIGSLSPA